LAFAGKQKRVFYPYAVWRGGNNLQKNYMYITKPSKHVVLSIILLTIGTIYGCRKSSGTTELQTQENITDSEVKEWFQLYEQNMPNAPKPDIKRLQKNFFQGRYIVKIPLKGSLGNIYFSKTNTNTLDVQYIRVVPQGDLISFPFNGAYEYIDMNTYDYRRVNYKNGKATKVKISLYPNNKGVLENNYRMNARSWFAQLFWCIGQYIVALPKRDSAGEWTECWGPGGNGPDENQNMQPDENGGTWTNINWFAFFENNIPPAGSTTIPGSNGGSGSGGIIGASTDPGSSVESDEVMTNSSMNQDILDYFIYDENAAKPRPSYSDMLSNALPAFWNPTDVGNYIGSEVKTALLASPNTCATRISHMLNGAGSLIPASPWPTFTGNNSKNYIVNALTMVSFLKSAYGTGSSNTVHLESTQGSPLTETQIRNALAGKQGIYVLIPVNPTNTGFGASGHVDLLDANGSFASGHDFYFANGGVKEIYLFILN
jgi:hypothetical protein